ncbi:hypothetical protein Tsubulata_045323 [Turnera subulata]|uniref:Uncharacterized protein n=1 Tax=Turnera subulata TaxID=218843 RepID=A0A9Q0JAT5_9ROSI|nr:hypothetical protein Tsubulata_045323 [Turnera subulata]
MSDGGRRREDPRRGGPRRGYVLYDPTPDGSGRRVFRTLGELYSEIIRRRQGRGRAGDSGPEISPRTIEQFSILRLDEAGGEVEEVLEGGELEDLRLHLNAGETEEIEEGGGEEDDEASPGLLDWPSLDDGIPVRAFWLPPKDIAQTPVPRVMYGGAFIAPDDAARENFLDYLASRNSVYRPMLAHYYHMIQASEGFVVPYDLPPDTDLPFKVIRPCVNYPDPDRGEPNQPIMGDRGKKIELCLQRAISAIEEFTVSSFFHAPAYLLLRIKDACNAIQNPVCLTPICLIVLGIR